MKIELKSFKHYAGMSEETNAFTANVYINNKLTAYAKNDGHGGCTYYSITSTDNETRDRLKSAEEYCKNLPDIVTDIKTKDGSFFSYKQNLEHYIDQLVSNKIETQWLNRLAGKNKVVFQDRSCGKGEWLSIQWKAEAVHKAVRMKRFIENYMKKNDVIKYFDLISKQVVEVK